ncbi:MAG: hypothetical protein HWN65_09245 [Candidatus Helarchaeota archaeon]|nr:hypothetical protein [Candidatus Helarchaeota archaeon]
MAWEELEDKKGMRITHLVMSMASAGLYFIIAIALWLTIDFTAYMINFMAPIYPTMPGLQNLLIAALIAQTVGGFLIVIAAGKIIIKTIMKEGRP